MSPRFHTNESELVRQLLARGHEIRYLVHEHRYSEDHSTVVPQVLGYMRSPFRMADDAARLRRGLYPAGTSRRVARLGADVVVLKGFRAATLLLSWQLRLRGQRVLMHVQRDVADPERRPSRRLYQRLFGRFVVSPVRRTQSTPQGGRRWGQEWHYAPFVAAVVPGAAGRPYRVGGVTRFLIVGKFIRRKNVLTALEVLVRAHGLGHALETTVVGTVVENETEYFQSVRRLSEKHPWMHVLRDVEHSDMDDLYRRHDVLVMPSVAEAASYSQLEAMSHGLAVVICSDNGTAGYVEDGSSGLVFEPSPFREELERCVGALLGDPPSIARFGRRGRELVESEHGADHFERVLCRVADSSRRRL